eukprot:SAG31_NODE_34458_length_332_cov_1.991416_1_plen_69_part_10
MALNLVTVVRYMYSCTVDLNLDLVRHAGRTGEDGRALGPVRSLPRRVDDSEQQPAELATKPTLCSGSDW